MSKPTGAQFVVLCEDLQAQVFICRALVHAGANHRRIRRVALPSTVSGGAGHAYVITNYPREVKAFRLQNAKASTCLIVHIDADPTHRVAERHTELATSLKKAGGAPRQQMEPIVELVPKRNIETWIYALDASLASELIGPIDEIGAYPKFKAESKCAKAAEAFANLANTNAHPAMAGAVPSLLDGIAEFKRRP